MGQMGAEGIPGLISIKACLIYCFIQEFTDTQVSIIRTKFDMKMKMETETIIIVMTRV